MNQPLPMEAMAEIFGSNGPLAQNLQGYEMREAQVTMAQAVRQALTGSMLAVEAGTGIGKTLAYLVPAALSRQKVIISTGTLNLQDQIINKEIPFLKKHIDPDLSVLCVKGRQNYLCLYRWQQFASNPQMTLMDRDDDDYIVKIQEWLEKTKTGDRAELTWLSDNSPLWQTLSATTSQCLGGDCPDGPGCFINQLRKEAARCRMLIVNHHLFFSDLALRVSGFAEVLPRYESVIFDEAHHLESVATRYFGSSMSQHQIIDLVIDIEKNAQQKLPERDLQRITQTSRALATQADFFFAMFPKQKGRFSLTEIVEQTPQWMAELQALKDRFIVLAERLTDLAINNEIWNGMQRRCEELLDSLLIVTEEQSSAYVYWYERRARTINLSASPVEVAPHLQQHFYDQVGSTVFTSATLTAGGEFSYFKNQLGVPEDIETLALPTPYDYSNRTVLYVPHNTFPPPGSAGYFHNVRQEVLEIIMAAKGRSLVLFTSIQAMEGMREYLSDQVPYPLLVQGSAPRAVLLERFKRETDSVLLAVASFWEGIDAPGKTLSCVIIDKLPFEVPSDPVIMARINKIREEGGNPFMEYQVPRAILALRQGIGRLMRASADRGVLAILDVRLFSKQYGKHFLKSLPPSPITRSIDDVKKFFVEGDTFGQE